MAKSVLSILGLYNYDPTVFDSLVLPVGINNQDIIDMICLDCAELELIYPSAQIMKQAIGLWSRTSLDKWNKLLKTTQLEYNPIWNKDGTITETETINRDSQGSVETSSSAANNAETINDVSAFNATDYQHSGKDSTSATDTVETGSESTGSEDSTRSYTRTEQGNIGLTSTQELIKQEREISDYIIEQVISDDFKNRFCILIY